MQNIIHIDMDAYFAAVEQRDFPQYRNKPVVVGGDPEKRGVVATCSYEARKFGIHSAMPCAHAMRLCPNAIFLRPRFEVYRQISQQIQDIMFSYTDFVEPLSLDEAYLDVNDCKRSFGSPTLVAKAIKKEITQATGLTASAGVSYNKFLAKIASDMDKPNGLTLITEKQGPDFVRALPIGKFYGVGPATETKMHNLGIYSGEDLLAWSLEELKPVFGKVSEYYYLAARAIDHRKVVSHRERKSIGSEKTYSEDVSDYEEMLSRLKSLADEVWYEMQIKKLTARTITVKVKFDNFVQVTRAVTLSNIITKIEDINGQLDDLLSKAEVNGRRVRLLGVSVSKLSVVTASNDEQLTLL
ncbi:MAG: DNA polymerase IV [Pseudomonadota bacterium]